MSHSDALDYLATLPRYGSVADDARKPGLERMEALMDAMGRPHDALRAVHVAGTNGKGTTASLTAAIATAAGLETGLHTSPHLTHVEQRLRIDGTPAPTEWLVDTIDEHRDLLDRVAPSFFELMVALTFRYFADREVDLAVVEVGLGGRLDGTNVLNPALSVITNIDLDHTDLLGDTIGDIAREKAGIIKPDTPVLSGATQTAAKQVIAEVAAEQDAPLHRLRDEVAWQARRSDLFGSEMDVETPLRTYDRLSLPLPGAHQQANAALAVRAAELVVPAVQDDPTLVHEGLRNVQSLTGFRGRLEVLQDSPLIIVDVAHNPPGIAAGLRTVDATLRERGGRLFVALNVVDGKGLPDIAQLLAEHEASAVPIPVDTKRALPPDEIAATLRAHNVTVHAPRSVEQVLADYRRRAEAEDVLLLTGSHKMVELLPDSVFSRAK